MQPQALESHTLSEASKSGILTELDRILSSDLFARSAVLSNFLKFIVIETIENQPETLKEYTIAVSALGKPSDFNPQIDAIVRIHAGRLRRLLSEYYLGVGIADPIRIEVIKGTYIPGFRTNVLNEAKTSLPEKFEPIKFSRSKLTLVVLPFRNLCPANEYQFFADGFGAELTRVFSRFQDIAVIAHHSALKYADDPSDVRLIGADLGAHYIIDGSVKRTAEEIKVGVGLIETMNGVQIWSQTYKYTLNIDNLTTIQDHIIDNVSSILAGYYGLIIHQNAKSHRQTIPSLDSFDAALWNYYFHIHFSQESYIQTLQALKVALKHDPNDPTCLAMLSELYLDAYSLGYPTAENPVKEGFNLAKKAIALDPQCQHAYQQFGWANIYMKRKDDALKAMEHCLELNPSSVSSKGAIGFGMACAGEYKRANELLAESLELNPHCPWWFHFGFFLVHYQARQYQKAIESAEKIEVPDVFLGPLARSIAKSKIGLHHEAIQDANTLIQTFPEINRNLQMYLDTFILDTQLVHQIVQEFKNVKTLQD
jgi:TolB-like protein